MNCQQCNRPGFDAVCEPCRNAKRQRIPQRKMPTGVECECGFRVYGMVPQPTAALAMRQYRRLAKMAHPDSLKIAEQLYGPPVARSYVCATCDPAGHP